jgi:hypothetical protein
MSKPAWVRKLEEYRIVIDAVAAISTVAAFAALYASIQATRAAQEGTRAAQEDLRLQQAVSQPVFQVGAIRSADGTLKELKVTNPSGTYFNAEVRTDEYLVLGRGIDEHAKAEESLIWDSPEQERVLIPYFYWDDAPSKDDIANYAPYRDPPIMDFVRSWRATAGRRAEVGVVTYITISYRDMLQKDHKLYFKIGGTYDKMTKLPSLGRNLKPGDQAVAASWREPAEGEPCSLFYPEDGDGELLNTFDNYELLPQDERGNALRSLYEKVKSQQTEEIRKMCA